jgi:hypothetical protein
MTGFEYEILHGGSNTGLWESAWKTKSTWIKEKGSRQSGSHTLLGSTSAGSTYRCVTTRSTAMPDFLRDEQIES